jgi:prophage antirepressor-like protein
MDILKAFSLCDKEYPINILGTIDEPLFQANQIGKLLEMTNINKLLSSFDNNEKVITQSSTLGGMQNLTFLTERGLYKVLARSNKPIAKKFQDWMVNVIKELRQQGEYRLKQEHEIEKKLIKSQEQINAKKNIHNTFMDFCKMKNVVYVCKLRDETENTFLIKIGSTQNVKERFANIQTNYKMTPLLLNIFECENHTKFEKWVRQNESIKSLYYEIKKNDGTSAKETFLVNEEQYNNIIKIMHSGVKMFVKEDVDKLIKLKDRQIIEAELIVQQEKIRLEQEQVRVQQKRIDLERDNMQMKQEQLRLQQDEIQLKMQENAKLENAIIPTEPQNEIIEPQEPQEEVNYVKNREHTRSPKVYQYDPKTLELIQIYDSIITVTRHFSSSSGSALREAARNNRTYKEFRWLMVDRNTTEVPVPLPTVECRTQSIEFIAMIDIKKTKILEVFPSQKDAAMARNLAGFSTISRAIKEERVSSGHYWNIFDRCSQEMRDEYLKTNVLPEYHVKSNGITVIQINPITNENMKTYKSITEVLKNFQMSRITLNKISDNNEIHNGFKWKVIKN